MTKYWPYTNTTVHNERYLESAEKTKRGRLLLRRRGEHDINGKFILDANQQRRERGRNSGDSSAELANYGNVSDITESKRDGAQGKGKQKRFRITTLQPPPLKGVTGAPDSKKGAGKKKGDRWEALAQNLTTRGGETPTRHALRNTEGLNVL